MTSAIGTMIDPSEARYILTTCGAWNDYHSLSSDAVDALAAAAKAHNYRKRKDAPGSKTRMFHAYLLRRARSLHGYAVETTRNRPGTSTFKLSRRSVVAERGRIL